MEEHLERLLFELGSAVNEGPLGAARVVDALNAPQMAEGKSLA